MQQFELIETVGRFDSGIHKYIDCQPGAIVALEFNVRPGKYNVHCFTADCSCESFKLKQLDGKGAILGGTVTIDPAEALLQAFPNKELIEIEKELTVYFESELDFFNYMDGQRYFNNEKLSIPLKMTFRIDMSAAIAESKRKTEEQKYQEKLSSVGAIQG